MTRRRPLCWTQHSTNTSVTPRKPRALPPLRCTKRAPPFRTSASSTLPFRDTRGAHAFCASSAGSLSPLVVAILRFLLGSRTCRTRPFLFRRSASTSAAATNTSFKTTVCNSSVLLFRAAYNTAREAGVLLRPLVQTILRAGLCLAALSTHSCSFECQRAGFTGCIGGSHYSRFCFAACCSSCSRNRANARAWNARSLVCVPVEVQDEAVRL